MFEISIDYLSKNRKKSYSDNSKKIYFETILFLLYTLKSKIRIPLNFEYKLEIYFGKEKKKCLL